MSDYEQYEENEHKDHAEAAEAAHDLECEARNERWFEEND